MKYIFAFICSLISCQLSLANLTIPHFFADNMVLQQSSKVKIWGKSTSKKKIQIQTSWDGKRYQTFKDQAGNWSLWVETPKAGGPYKIQIQQEETLTLHDVLIGEVWICSGQSNMDIPVKGYYGQPILHATEMLLESPNDQIRLFQVERQHAENAQFDLKGSWSVANTASVVRFSALGYQFAKYLQQHLNVPVGIIQAAWGGSAKHGIAYQTPTLDKIVILNDTVFVSMKHCPMGLTSYGKPLTQFELAGADQIFHPATAVLQNNRIVVTSTAVQVPVAVRYAFHDWCFGELYRTEGIPVASFRSDDWP